MAIFRDPVSGLQVFGYGIALAGLVYYKLGADTLKQYAMNGGQNWSKYRAQHPALSKMIMFFGVLFIILVVMGGLFPYVPAEYTNGASNLLGKVGSGEPGE